MDLRRSLLVAPAQALKNTSLASSSSMDGAKDAPAFLPLTVPPCTTHDPMEVDHEDDDNKKNNSSNMAGINTFSSLPLIINPQSLGFVSVEEFEREAKQELLSSNTSLNSNNQGIKPTSISSPPIPIALERKRAAEHVPQFNHLCQKRGLTPIFDFIEPEKQKFGVTLTVGGIVILEPGPFDSKKDAKEFVAEQGIKAVENLLSPDAKQDEKAAENYYGQLIEFMQASAAPMPQVQDFSLGDQFACEITIELRSTQPFGERMRPFKTKKAAKQDAAREVIEWLKQGGYLDRIRSNSRKTEPAAKLSTFPKTVSEESYAHQVVTLCQNLGLSPPEYRLVPDQRAPSFISGAAYFPREPILPGPIGEVRNVFGKKAAKEECAKGVVEQLKMLQAKRLEMIQRMR